MNDPYKAPESTLDKPPRRIFATPLIVPLSVFMVIVIYAGYTWFFFTHDKTGIFPYLNGIAFEVFIVTQAGTMLLTLLVKNQLDGYLRDHPRISDRESLEDLKPVMRTNMYSALCMLLFTAVGSLTAIMSILNDGLVTSIFVVVLALLTGRVTKWGSRSEEKIKQIECGDPELEEELGIMFHCWQNKPLPKF